MLFFFFFFFFQAEDGIRDRNVTGVQTCALPIYRDYYLERKYPSFGNLAPRDIASRAAKEVCDEGRGVGPGGRGVYLDFADAIRRIGVQGIHDRYENLFDMYAHITNENPYMAPMRIYPAVHYCMGGLWV